MVTRVITQLAIGQQIRYYDKMYTVKDLYPFIAYLYNENENITICVNVGDLVIAGIEPMAPINKSVLVAGLVA